MEDETGGVGVAIKEFVRLKLKMYSCLLDDSGEQQRV